MTDFKQIKDKLTTCGFTRDFAAVETESGNRIERWRRGARAIVVIADAAGACGLYSFVGEENAPVEDDLEFIESLAD